MRQATLIREWVHRCQIGTAAYAKASSLSYRGNILYSYSTPIAKCVRNDKGDVAFYVTTRSYSVTTSKQCSMLWVPLNDAKVPVFRVEEVAPGGKNEITHEPTPEEMLEDARNRSRDIAGNHRLSDVTRDELLRKCAREIAEFVRFWGISFYTLSVEAR